MIRTTAEYILVCVALLGIYLMAPSEQPTIKIGDRICVAGRC